MDKFYYMERIEKLERNLLNKRIKEEHKWYVLFASVASFIAGFSISSWIG